MNVQFTVNMNKEVEDCIEQHINSDNHQAAIRSEGIESSEPQSEQQHSVIATPTESTLKKRVQRRINDLDCSTQIHIKRLINLKSYVSVTCFKADEYDAIDAHINAYHKDKGGQEGQYLQQDQASQPSAQESYYPDPVGHYADPQSYIYGSGTYVDPGRHLYAPEHHGYGTQSHQGSHVYGLGSQGYGSGSQGYAQGSQGYGSGSNVYAPGSTLYAPGSHDYGIQPSGSTTQRGQGSQYYGIEDASPQERYDFFLALQASLNEPHQNRPFQIPDPQSTPTSPPQQSAPNPPQQSDPRNQTKGKEKAQRKH
uniref:Uncharacterized protein n=1 Tax=Meloidogyne enterolobii TaxID=390850 RepID=A0A6V7UKT0_MELEN|nr:unnamed protein product [Meloidogyne enterolobii]